MAGLYSWQICKGTVVRCLTSSVEKQTFQAVSFWTDGSGCISLHQRETDWRCFRLLRCFGGLDHMFRQSLNFDWLQFTKVHINLLRHELKQRCEDLWMSSCWSPKMISRQKSSWSLWPFLHIINAKRFTCIVCVCLNQQTLCMHQV